VHEAKSWLKRDQSEAGGGAEGLETITDLELLVDVCEVEIYGAFGDKKGFGSFFAAFALGDLA